MPHLIELAPTGRAKCRGCGAAIPKGTPRLGEAVPNLYAEAEGAESTQWYHPACGAYRRPEAFLAAVAQTSVPLLDRGRLEAAAALGAAHHRLARVDRASRAPSGRAACRACRAPIPKDAWRIGLLFWQDGRFVPAGYIHPACAASYLETTDILDRLRHFSPDLTDDDAADIARALVASADSGPAADPASGA
ncbi:MAG: hypothetical protein R2745_17605 [Vicinamibacterales bacterium]